MYFGMQKEANRKPKESEGNFRNCGSTFARIQDLSRTLILKGRKNKKVLRRQVMCENKN